MIEGDIKLAIWYFRSAVNPRRYIHLDDMMMSCGRHSNTHGDDHVDDHDGDYHHDHDDDDYYDHGDGPVHSSPAYIAILIPLVYVTVYSR